VYEIELKLNKLIEESFAKFLGNQNTFGDTKAFGVEIAMQ
jgi:hypothetical protein